LGNITNIKRKQLGVTYWRCTVPKKLIINDTSDYIGRWQLFSWSNDSDVITLPVGSSREFIDGLNGLIRQGMVFDRVLFRTHGDNGCIWLGNDPIYSWGWDSLAGEINFPALFPGPTKVYFDSCDTAKGRTGTFFLMRAGQYLLRAGGGSTSAWASWGLAVPGRVPFFGGHTIHIPNSENLKTLYFNPGGVLVSPVAAGPSNAADVWGDKGKYQKPNIGNKI
jgi:hypothetical protein